jgi:uncharacterized protein YbcI
MRVSVREMCMGWCVLLLCGMVSWAEEFVLSVGTGRKVLKVCHNTVVNDIPGEETMLVPQNCLN